MSWQYPGVHILCTINILPAVATLDLGPTLPMWVVFGEDISYQLKRRLAAFGAGDYLWPTLKVCHDFRTVYIIQYVLHAAGKCAKG